MGLKENLAFIFPGQGSQKIGMLADLAEQYDVVLDTFREASEVLGYDLWQTVQDGPQEKLNMTEITQPALLASSVALWRAWQQKSGVVPSYVAGHSLGEWSALVCAGVVKFSDAIQWVRSRGKYMQEAVPAGEGAMAAIIGLDDKTIEDVCQSVSSEQVVAPVNYNSPGQLVIAGEKNAVDQAITAAKEAGAKKAMLLPVSAPFHTSMMKPAADRLAQDIANTEFSKPEITVVHNVTAEPESNPEKIKELVIEQIYSPVRWVECIQYLKNSGVEQVMECGPGKVLTGLNRRIDKTITSYTTDSQASFEKSLEEL